MNILSMKGNDYMWRGKKYSSDIAEETEKQLTLLFICEMNVCFVRKTSMTSERLKYNTKLY